MPLPTPGRHGLHGQGSHRDRAQAQLCPPPLSPAGCQPSNQHGGGVGGGVGPSSNALHTHTHTHHTTPREIAGNSTQAPVVVGGGVHLADPPAGFSFCFDRWAGWLAAPQVGQDGAKVELQKASITLSDCLACSGCVTSAESVLVEMQNYKELEYS